MAVTRQLGGASQEGPRATPTAHPNVSGEGEPLGKAGQGSHHSYGGTKHYTTFPEEPRMCKHLEKDLEASP